MEDQSNMAAAGIVALMTKRVFGHTLIFNSYTDSISTDFTSGSDLIF